MQNLWLFPQQLFSNRTLNKRQILTTYMSVLGVVLRKRYDTCFCIEKRDFLKEIESSIRKDALINYIAKKVQNKMTFY